MTDSDEVKLLPCIEEIWRVADLIRHAEVSTPLGPRSVGYYLSVGLDHFNHPHDRFQELLNAAAEAVMKDATRPPVVTDEVVELRRLVEKWDATSEFSTDNLYLFTEALVGTVRAALASMPAVVSGT